MGGNAFTNAWAPGAPALRTPRMDFTTYNTLKTIYLDRLQEYFPSCQVAVPIEPPEKKDYGDLDIIVSTDQQVSFRDLAHHVGAFALITTWGQSVQVCNFAVETDGSRSNWPAVEYHVDDKGYLTPAEKNNAFKTMAQVDIMLVPTALFPWRNFCMSYGGLTIVLGRLLGRLGFGMTDKSLFLYVQQFDDVKHLRAQITAEDFVIAEKDDRLYLTSDPDSTLRFLNLSPERYSEGFRTQEELFEWVYELVSPELIQNANSMGNPRKEKGRPAIYNSFFDDWLPLKLQSRDRGKPDASTSESHAMRQQRLENAIRFFKQEVQFEHMHATLLLQLSNAIAIKFIKSILELKCGLAGKGLAEVIRALRRRVGYRDGQLYQLEKPHSVDESELHRVLDATSHSLRDPRMVETFLVDHWQTVRSLERKRVKGRVEDSFEDDRSKRVKGRVEDSSEADRSKRLACGDGATSSQ